MEDDTFTYTYDDEGNRTSRVRKGTGFADKTTVYTWDYRNRLAQVENKNDAGTVTMRVKYQYDAWDRMTRRIYDPDGDTGSQALATEYYLHDGSQRIMHILADSAISHFYMFNPVTDEALFSQTDGTYAVLTDHLGTVHDLVDYQGQVVDHFVYDAFGNMVNGTSQVSWRNRLGFAGAFYEAATGLQYNHHRWYDPQSGRWMSEDPIGFAGGDSNLNRYVGNQVTTSVDPDGLQERGGIGTRSGSWRSMIDPQSRAESLRATMRAGESAEMLQGGLYGASFAPFEGWCRGHKLGYDAATDPLGTANEARMAAGRAIHGGLSFMGDPAGTVSNWWDNLSPGQQGQIMTGGALSALGMVYGLPGRVDPPEVPKPSLTAHKKALEKVHCEVGQLPKGRPGKFGSPERSDSRKGYRLDPPHPGAEPGSPESKYHYNWWDYTTGKKNRGGRHGAEPIED
jgi:RHS repeat-associated protein